VIVYKMTTMANTSSEIPAG